MKIKFHVILRKIPTTTIIIIIIIISIALYPYPLEHMLNNNVHIYSHSSQVRQLKKSRIISSWAVSVYFVSSPLFVFDKVPLRNRIAVSSFMLPWFWIWDRGSQVGRCFVTCNFLNMNGQQQAMFCRIRNTHIFLILQADKKYEMWVAHKEN